MVAFTISIQHGPRNSSRAIRKTKNKKHSMTFMTIMVGTFLALIIGCFIIILKKLGGIHSFNPAFVPNVNQILQVAHITAISPLAFSGFEIIFMSDFLEQRFQLRNS